MSDPNPVDPVDVSNDFWAERARRYQAKFDAMCEHMKALILHCEAVGVKFGGCGDCGSAWLECAACGTTEDNAHDVFDRATGGRPK